ncbi:hypothetical protein FPV67DRAFT_1449015 [Lyophyllum atratum]|nr:hypothetical protein FPV67DRAFT_1449015 [Lyophyllum atratum]
MRNFWPTAVTSTGSLGSQILATLLEDDRVAWVYALNRPSKGAVTIQERHVKRFKDNGLNPDLLENSELLFVLRDAPQPNMGFEGDLYSQIWTERTGFAIRIHLIRCLCTIRNTSLGPVPKEAVTDASTAVAGGYREGKSPQKRPASNVSTDWSDQWRVSKWDLGGQISGGSPNGTWATTDWLPFLVKSSVTLGMLLRVEGLKNAIKHVFGLNLELLPLSNGFSVIESHAAGATCGDLEDYPFFREVARANDEMINSGLQDVEIGGRTKFSTERMLRFSSVVRNLHRLASQDAGLWVRYWHEVKFLEG